MRDTSYVGLSCFEHLAPDRGAYCISILKGSMCFNISSAGCVSVETMWVNMCIEESYVCLVTA